MTTATVPALLAKLSLDAVNPGACTGPEGFAEIARWGRAIPIRLALAVLAAALVYHLLAGVRHLLMDAGIGSSLRAGRGSARAVLAAGVVAFVVAAVRLFG